MPLCQGDNPGKTFGGHFFPLTPEIIWLMFAHPKSTVRNTGLTHVGLCPKFLVLLFILPRYLRAWSVDRHKILHGDMT